MAENIKNLRFTRKRFLAQLRENLKNSDTEDTAWFNLLPYKKEDPQIADTIEGLLNKAVKFWKVITIVEKRYSRDIKISKNYPMANWFLLKVDRKEFAVLCSKYGIKGPDEEDEDGDDEFASLKTSTIKKAEKLTGNPVKKMEVFKDHRGYHIKINGKFVYSIRSGVYGERIYEIAKSGKCEIDFDLGKGVLSWFNSNSDNPIYKKGSFDKTKILEYRSDFLYPANDINIFLKE